MHPYTLPEKFMLNRMPSAVVCVDGVSSGVGGVQEHVRDRGGHGRDDHHPGAVQCQAGDGRDAQVRGVNTQPTTKDPEP